MEAKNQDSKIAQPATPAAPAVPSTALTVRGGGENAAAISAGLHPVGARPPLVVVTDADYSDPTPEAVYVTMPTYDRDGREVGSVTSVVTSKQIRSRAARALFTPPKRK